MCSYCSWRFFYHLLLELLRYVNITKDPLPIWKMTANYYSLPFIPNCPTLLINFQCSLKWINLYIPTYFQLLKFTLNAYLILKYVLHSSIKNLNHFIIYLLRCERKTSTKRYTYHRYLSLWNIWPVKCKIKDLLNKQTIYNGALPFFW